MREVTVLKILVISGFLGAGKTTFIRELIRRTKKHPVVLENEFGECSLDSRALKGAGELRILEFMEGCVCCTRRDSFASTVVAVSASLDPDYLVVEPTGIARLSGILENLRRVSYEKILLLPPVVIVCPRSLPTFLRDYPDVCADQLRWAERVVLSKLKGEDAAVIEDAVRRIRELNDHAEILATPYEEQEDPWFDGLFVPTGTELLPGEPSGAVGKDRFRQISLNEGRFQNLEELVVFLEDLLRGDLGDLIRAKGTIRVGWEWMRFDAADGLYAVTAELPEDQQATRCVFIGRAPDDMAIRARLRVEPEIGVHPFRRRRRSCG